MPGSGYSPDQSDELRRVAEEIAGRLRQRGVHLTGDETSDELANILEAVERFETVIERLGGDLMMDEPVNQGAPVQPDNAAFVLPARTPAESVASYLNRIADAEVAARRARRR